MMGIEWLRPAAFLGSMLYALIGVFIFWLCLAICFIVFSFVFIVKLCCVYMMWGGEVLR